MYPDQLSCDYRGMLTLLSDAFIAGLPQEGQQADAYSYRAQAQYHQTMQRGVGAAQGRLALQLALNDNTQALRVRDDAVDQYTRALILEALNEPARALESYRWVLHWSDLYHYPFHDRSLEQRVALVAERAVWPEPTTTPAAATPTSTAAETRTPTIVTATPTMRSRTATPSPVTLTPIATPLPPDEIP
jgi:hypothetical protein